MARTWASSSPPVEEVPASGIPSLPALRTTKRETKASAPLFLHDAANLSPLAAVGES